MDTLLEKLGRGEISVDDIFATTNQERPRWFNMMGFTKTLRIPSECCRPIPGDPVVGLFKSGIGMLIHHQSCAKVDDKQDKKWLDVVWDGEEKAYYSAKVQVRSRNKPGMLANTTACLESFHVNIEDITLDQTSGGGITTVNMLLQVRSCQHLADVMEKLELVDGVTKVARNIDFSVQKRNVSNNIKQMLFGQKEFDSKK